MSEIRIPIGISNVVADRATSSTQRTIIVSLYIQCIYSVLYAKMGLYSSAQILHIGCRLFVFPTNKSVLNPFLCGKLFFIFIDLFIYSY